MMPVQKLEGYKIRFIGGQYDEYAKAYDSASAADPEVGLEVSRQVVNEFVNLVKIKTTFSGTPEYKTSFSSDRLKAEEVLDDLMTLISSRNCLIKKCDELIFHTGVTKMGLHATIVFKFIKKKTIALVAAYPAVQINKELE